MYVAKEERMKSICVGESSTYFKEGIINYFKSEVNFNLSTKHSTYSSITLERMEKI